ncbi:S8 family serine peptidase [Lacrimispora xylanisolvens]|uniref:S8 family serine peptidase n=1 Tax=Lacrimispora xylanisolvens TaxID=384636 RepID=UPI0032E7F980
MSRDKSGIGSVQQNSYLGLMGKGVLVGVVDTGIEYTHPAFQNPDGTSRIYSIWDQTIQEGTPPDSFTFGTEYKKEQINEALLSSQPLTVVPSTDNNGHGTAIASIAAGSPSADLSFSGVVPLSELVIVKLKDAKNNLKIFSLFLKIPTVFRNRIFIWESVICCQFPRKRQDP